jgi:hypothetical protein
MRGNVCFWPKSDPALALHNAKTAEAMYRERMFAMA